MKTHEVKIEQGFFEEIKQGNKTAEIRFNDRDYQRGDNLDLKEIDNLGVFTGRRYKVTISHVLAGWGLKENFVLLSFKKHP